MDFEPARTERLERLLDRYTVILSDVWGVVHNGVRPFVPACRALASARDAGKAVILITNAPRPAAGVEQQFKTLGVPDNCWDRIVTSGDVTRSLIAENGRAIFHLGPDRDLPLYDGLDVGFADAFEATAVCCTGLFDDEAETPDDYDEMLRQFRSKNLPFICANPDVVVERGDRLIWCAGALARNYGQLGGRTLIAGKPHRPIYEASLAAAADVLGRPVEPSEVLAIGDGVMTDVKGAADFGLDVLFISAGIHAAEYGDPSDPDEPALHAFLKTHGYETVGYMPRLK